MAETYRGRLSHRLCRLALNLIGQTPAARRQIYLTPLCAPKEDLFEVPGANPPICTKGAPTLDTSSLIEVAL
jgi:hypothetical protein